MIYQVVSIDVENVLVTRVMPNYMLDIVKNTQEDFVMKSTKSNTLALIGGEWYHVCQINPSQNTVIVQDSEGKEQLFSLHEVSLFKDEPLVRLKHLLDATKKQRILK